MSETETDAAQQSDAPERAGNGAADRLPPGARDESGKVRFLIVRMSALGDVVHTLPVLHALRAAHPDAEIGWLVEDRFSQLLEGHPELTRLHVLPRKAWRALGFFKRLSAVAAFNRELREFNYTVAIDVQSLTKSAYFAGKSGAVIRIGFAPPEGREISGWFHTVRVSPGPHVKHVAERHLSLLVPLGIHDAKAIFVFPDLADEARQVAELIGGIEDPDAKYCVIHAGSSWPSKQWPVDHFAAVAKRIAGELGLRVVLTGAGDLERSRAESVAREVNGNAIVAPPISIRQLTALTQRAVLFVAGDTGPMHIAAALGVPTVAVLGPTKGERNGPLGGHTRWIDAGLGCIGCRRRKCPDGTDACMRGVQPDDVFDLVKDVLGIVDADANADADAEAEADAEVAERE